MTQVVEGVWTEIHQIFERTSDPDQRRREVRDRVAKMEPQHAQELRSRVRTLDRTLSAEGESERDRGTVPQQESGRS